MNLKFNQVQKILILLALFFAAAYVNFIFNFEEFYFWLLFLPGLVLASALFELYGAAFYTALVGLCGLVSFYYGFVSVDMTYEEISTLLYGYLFFLVNLLLVSIVFTYYVKKLKKEKEAIKEIVLIDQLTGLKNYGYFVTRLQEERIRADREDKELSLIMIDIDRFKEFNDRFGHQRGNELLIKASKIIEENIRSNDIVCRYGGEEFAVILPGTSLKKAFEIAERIRKAFEETFFYGNKAFPRVKKTVSCGVASYPMQANDELELIDMADRALYYAKESGRNKTVIYSDEVELKWFKGLAGEEF